MRVSIDELTADPHPVWASLRRAAPIAWVEPLGGWVTLTRSLAVDVMRDAALFTVDDPRFTTARVVGPSMLSLDGDEHARHRGAFASRLRAADVDGLGPWLDAAAAALVDQLRPAGGCEVRAELAGPWSVQVMARVLGLAVDDGGVATLLRWYRDIVAGVEAVSVGGDVPSAAVRSVAALADAVGVPSFVESASLTPSEIASNVAVFLFGGVETTEATITTALHHLLSDRHLLAMVRDDPVLLAAFVDESQRLEPAATRVDRYATRDVVVGGQQLHEGDLVIVSLAAAGRDPAAFEAPDELRIGRPNARGHLAFATGPHACIGAQLARRETTAMLRALIETYGDLLLDRTCSEPPSGLVFRKPGRLTIEWTP